MVLPWAPRPCRYLEGHEHLPRRGGPGSAGIPGGLRPVRTRRPGTCRPPDSPYRRSRAPTRRQPAGTRGGLRRTLQARIECDIAAVPLPDGKPADPGAFAKVDAVVVGGGLTPAYWEALHPAAATIRRLVADGAPYLGFSAGAMVAPRRALVGGYKVNGVEVCGEECSEGLDSVDIREGLGLAGFSVDVHAAQAGTLSRAVSAVAAGLVERTVAIDEQTAVVLAALGDGDYDVIGSGHCWDVHRSGGTAVVSLRAAP